MKNATVMKTRLYLAALCTAAMLATGCDKSNEPTSKPEQTPQVYEDLMDCYDKSHPIDYYGDIEWRCRLSDYARSIFGIFGSEDGREWAIPQADFFEGIAGVAGSDFHTFKIEELGAIMLPIFEMVYHDCIAAYGKYGYDIHKSAPFVLRHIALGRPMYHHSVPPHLYWETEQAPAEDNPAPEAIFL